FSQACPNSFLLIRYFFCQHNFSSKLPNPLCNHEQTGVVNLSGTKRFSREAQFIPGGQYRNFHFLTYPDGMIPRCRRDSDSDGIEPDPFFKQKVSLPEVLSCRAVVVVCILPLLYSYFLFLAVSLFLLDDSIRPIWNRCPRHDPRCFPRPDFPLRIFSRPQFFHNPQADRRLFSGIPDIFRTEGIPIIGRSWKRRIVLPGPDLFSKNS